MDGLRVSRIMDECNDGRTIRTLCLICRGDDLYASAGRGVAALGVPGSMRAGPASDRTTSATCKLFW